MIGGQVLDMDGESPPFRCPTCKSSTASRPAHCLRLLPARSDRRRERPMARWFRPSPHYGRHLGMAFQIVDDVLDVTSTPEQMGKATNKDANRGKNTYPSLLGLEGSRQEAASHLTVALDSLGSIGPAADGLRSLARFVVERNV